MNEKRDSEKRRELLDTLKKSLIGSAPLLLTAAYGASTITAADQGEKAEGYAAEGVTAASEAQGEGEAEADVAAGSVTRPDDYQPYQGDREDLLAYGEELYADPRLSSTGVSCMTCHAGGAQYNDSFAEPYPHLVEMAQSQFGIDRIHLDEMIQVCMVIPMEEAPMAWDSRDLAALVEYYEQVEQPAFQEQQ